MPVLELIIALSAAVVSPLGAALIRNLVQILQARSAANAERVAGATTIQRHFRRRREARLRCGMFEIGLVSEEQDAVPEASAPTAAAVPPKPPEPPAALPRALRRSALQIITRSLI
jgi:hypothetical protein